MLLIVNITVRRAALAEFRRFEHAAAAIMARHGGTIERALVIEPKGVAQVIDGGDETLRELHVVRFRDAAGYAAYRADPEILALLPLRQASVVATETWHASEGPSYGA